MPTKQQIVDETAEFVAAVIDLINTGGADAHVQPLYDALDARIKAHSELALKREQQTTTAQKGATPILKTKMGAASGSKPVIGGSYLIRNPKREELKGAPVTLLSIVEGENPVKVVVEMATDRPGYPKGKKMRFPFLALKERPAARKPAAAPESPSKGTKSAPKGQTPTKRSAPVKSAPAPRKTATKSAQPVKRAPAKKSTPTKSTTRSTRK